MQVSQKTQKIIAIVCGLLLLGVLVAVLVNNNRSDTPTTSVTPPPKTQETQETQQEQKDQKKQETKKPDTTKEDTKTKQTEETKPVATPKPEQPAEPAKPAQPPKVTEAPKPQPKPPVTTKTKPSKDFTFVAEPGDSYTALAQGAVQTYAANNKLTLSETQQLQAAATLAANAGSPWLEIGQEVVIQQSDISAVIEAIAPVQAPKEEAEEVKKETKPETTEDKEVKKDTPATYTYTAVSGDSYAILARKAISEYAAASKLNLLPTQIIAAETTIIATAGFPALSVGQEVTFPSTLLKDAINAAQALSPVQLAAWQPYAALAGL